MVWDRLGHRIVWYMVMEEHFVWFLLTLGRCTHCVLTKTPVPIAQVTRPITRKTIVLNCNIFHALYHYRVWLPTISIITKYPESALSILILLHYVLIWGSIPSAARSKGRLQPLAFWDCGSESGRGRGCLSLVSVTNCHIKVSASGWSLVQRGPECGVYSECNRQTLFRMVITWNWARVPQE